MIPIKVDENTLHQMALTLSVYVHVTFISYDVIIWIEATIIFAGRHFDPWHRVIQDFWNKGRKLGFD